MLFKLSVTRGFLGKEPGSCLAFKYCYNAQSRLGRQCPYLGLLLSVACCKAALPGCFLPTWAVQL